MLLGNMWLQRFTDRMVSGCCKDYGERLVSFEEDQRCPEEGALLHTALPLHLCLGEREEREERETETEHVCEQARARGRVDVDATVV